jgi:YggT family protein
VLGSLVFRLIDLYSLVVLASVVISWIKLSPSNPLARAVHQLTEPVLRPIRARLPAMGGLDFSPMVLLFALQLLRRIL